MDIDRLIARLEEFDALRDKDVRERGSRDRIEPAYAEAWPEGVHRSIVRALDALGRSHPYQHQVDAIEQALGGADVVMESPTASGKTLAFVVPMLDALVRDRNAHALLLYPTKALALDQRGAIHELCKELSGVRKIQSWPYDGNVPPQDRKAIRQGPPAMLMTNPEYLNRSFLAHREQWEQNGFLLNLKYIVIDEMHEYRGFFGGNMALLLRRFLLHLKHLGVEPRIFMATATCANPKEHAEALTGRSMSLISAGDSLRPKREFAFINPDIPDFQYRDIFRLRIQNAALACLKEGMQTLIFCPSKKFIEEVYRRTRDACEEHGLDPNQLGLFHADIRAESKGDIQHDIKDGKIRVIFCTNALELGMDIGGMDGVILAGFPTNIMSAWQQMGRAGRGWDKDAFVLFYAMQHPIDRFFAGNLTAFLHKPLDRLVADPDNEELIKKHLPSLMEENPNGLTSADESVLGGTFLRIAINEQADPGYDPQHKLDLRGDIGRVFDLKHKSQSEPLGQISTARRFREAYTGAIFPFLGNRYRVLSHQEKAIELVDVEPYLRTDPNFYSFAQIGEHFQEKRFGNVAAIYYGRLDIFTKFTGFNLVNEKNNEKEYHEANEMLGETNRHALWISLLDQDELVRNGLSALEHLLRVGAMFVIPADRFDAGTLSKPGRPGEFPAVFYYETYAGGIGVAKNLFVDWKKALRTGIEVARNCRRCTLGCPDCIEPPKAYVDTKINKHLGIELAEKILDAARDESAVTSSVPPAPADDPVEALIAQGESDSVEFKSSLRQEEDTVLRTLAAFLNTEGGTLLIGVADDGAVLGVDADQFSDEDHMRQHFTDLVNSRMSGRTLHAALKATFETYDGKRVMRIACSRSATPAHVMEGTDQNFYIREGASAQKLTGDPLFEYRNWRFAH